jgi:hypothetical protein
MRKFNSGRIRQSQSISSLAEQNLLPDRARELHPCQLGLNETIALLILAGGARAEPRSIKWLTSGSVAE